MKIFTWISAAVLCVVLAGSAAAQSGMGMAFSRDILVGPFVTGGVAMNAGTLDTATTSKAGFSFSVGGVGYVPISEDMALSLGLAYDSRGFSYTYDYNLDGATSAATEDFSIGYFSIRPGFKFKGLEVGLGLGLPLSISGKVNGTSVTGVSTDSLNFLVEARAGFGFPLMKNDNTELRLLVQGSYGFTKLMKNGGTEDNGPLATAQVGVAYLFDVSHSSSY